MLHLRQLVKKINQVVVLFVAHATSLEVNGTASVAKFPNLEVMVVCFGRLKAVLVVDMTRLRVKVLDLLSKVHFQVMVGLIVFVSFAPRVAVGWGVDPESWVTGTWASDLLGARVVPEWNVVLTVTDVVRSSSLGEFVDEACDSLGGQQESKSYFLHHCGGAYGCTRSQLERLAVAVRSRVKEEIEAVRIKQQAKICLATKKSTPLLTLLLLPVES